VIVQVTARWDDTVLAVFRVDVRRGFTAGASVDCDYPVPAEAPVVIVPADPTWKPMSAERAGAYRGAGDSLATVGPITFAVEELADASSFLRTRSWTTALVLALTLSALVHGLVGWLAMRAPAADPETLDSERFHLMQRYTNAAIEREQESEQDDEVTPPRSDIRSFWRWSDARDPDEDACRRFSQTGYSLVWNGLAARCSSYDPGLSGLTSALADGVLAGEPPPLARPRDPHELSDVRSHYVWRFGHYEQRTREAQRVSFVHASATVDGGLSPVAVESAIHARFHALASCYAAVGDDAAVGRLQLTFAIDSRGRVRGANATLHGQGPSVDVVRTCLLRELEEMTFPAPDDVAHAVYVVDVVPS
jgi:hypothetical protein